MSETLFVLGTDKQFGTLQHLLNHHTGSILDAHHAIEFQS